MNTQELKLIIKTAENLGYNKFTVVIDDGRDGETAYVEAKAHVSKDAAGNIILVFDYE